jgi:flagellar biosynthesis/type III secretory pathway M-ring protein FliF/YscJ
MFGMDALEVMVLAAAIYVAVLTLVRLMHRRRAGIIDDLTEEVELERQRLKEERKQERRRRMREELERQQKERLEERSQRIAQQQREREAAS